MKKSSAYLTAWTFEDDRPVMITPLVHRVMSIVSLICDAFAGGTTMGSIPGNSLLFQP